MASYWLVFAYCVAQCVALNSQFRRDREARLPSVALWLPVVVILGLFAGLRSPGSSADYLNYSYWIEGISSGGVLGVANRDPVFELLGEALQSHGGGLVLFMLV